MTQNVKVKLSNITNLSDARFAAAAGIEFMGFCFDPKSINYIPPVKAKEIMDWTSGCFVIAEFGHQNIKEVTDIVEMLNIDIVELNNDLLPADLIEINKPIIKKIDTSLISLIELNNIFLAFENNVDAFHLYASNAVTLSTDELKQICVNHKIVWGFNILPENIKLVINTFAPYALNFVGGVEEKTGLKDFEELNNVLEELGMYEG
jgi:phosphoribosylanthranilate isomerase